METIDREGGKESYNWYLGLGHIFIFWNILKTVEGDFDTQSLVQASGRIPFTRNDKWENERPQKSSEPCKVIPLIWGKTRTLTSVSQCHVQGLFCLSFTGVGGESKFPEAGARTFQSCCHRRRCQLCLDVSYYAPDTGLRTFHSGTHLILLRPMTWTRLFPRQWGREANTVLPDKVPSAV